MPHVTTEATDGAREDAFRAFANWVLCWIVLPNIGFWLLWLVGAPPRPFAILVTGAVGLLVNGAPFPVKFVAFLGALTFSALQFISSLFNLSIHSLVDSLSFTAEMQVQSSPEYVGSAIAIGLTVAASWLFLRRSTRLRRPVLAVAAATLPVFAASADVSMTQGSVGSYGRVPVAGAPFTSGVSASGFAVGATPGRHLLLVMVEAMGQPSDPALRDRLVETWAPGPVRARYAVATGTSLFYGSTTSGEMRELCGRWGDYKPLLERADPSCLPARLRAAGYSTQAWHSFKGEFFQRKTWYPNIGFSSMRWSDRLMAEGARGCPGVFPGACDRDVPRQIAAELKGAERPQFIYWLTVNAHLPVLKSKRLGTDECARFDRRLYRELPMTCRLLQLLGDTGGALAHEIAAPDFPPTDILIVGDHIPPFFERRNREQFEPDRVPWILLRAKDGARLPQVRPAR